MTTLLCRSPFSRHRNAPCSTLLINAFPAARRPNYRSFRRLLIFAVEYFLRSAPDYPLKGTSANPRSTFPCEKERRVENLAAVVRYIVGGRNCLNGRRSCESALVGSIIFARDSASQEAPCFLTTPSRLSLKRVRENHRL